MHNKPATMSAEETNPELNGTATDTSSDPPPDTTAESKSETSPGAKKGPPVAPKPTWFRQSLRKIRDEQDQRKHNKAAEQRSTVGFNRSFGVRSASSAANQSIKQKIHSFETFSSPEGPDKVVNKKPVAPSTCLSLTEKESRSHAASNGNIGKVKNEIPKERQANLSASAETDNTSVSALTSSTSEAYNQTTVNSSEGEPPPVHSSTERPLPDITTPAVESGVHDMDTIQESESERTDFSRLAESESPSVRVSHAEGQSPPEETEEDGARSQEELVSTTPSAPPTTDDLKGLQDESLGKILAFSNQVSQVLMQSLPAFPCHGNPHSANLQQDSTNSRDCEPASDCTDRGFSVSLATLRECTIERGEGGVHDEATVTSACVHSVISTIPSQEIQRMIQEVKALDEETLKQLVDIHVVILHKEEGAGLGFSIAGGSDLESKAATVHRVFPSGLAAQEGTIQKGDEVLSINGKTLRGITHADATAALRQTRNLNLAVVVISKRAGGQEREGGGCEAEETNLAVEEQGAPVSVLLEKGAGGVGFTLEGGKGSINGDRPLVINRIFQGGAAEQSGLQHGDTLLQIQGVSLQDMTRFEAWNMIKALPEGPITAVIRRRQGGVE